MASASVVDSLVIMLGLDPTGVKQGMNQAQQAMTQGTRQLNDTGKVNLRLDSDKFKKGLNEAQTYTDRTVSAIISRFSGIAAAYVSIQGIFGLSQNFLAGADAASKMAKAIGVNMEELQAWSEAAARSGGSIEGFRGSLQQLSASLSEISVKGTSRAKIFYDELGISVTDAEGKVRGAFDVMEDLASVFEKIGAQEAMGIGRKLGFDQGTIQTLQMGRKSLQELVKHQKEMGVFTERDAEVAEKYNDTMDDFKQSMQAVFSTVFRPVFAWLTRLLEKGIEFATFLQKHQTFLKAFFAMITVALTTMLIPAFYRLAAAMLANPITWLIAGFALMAAAIDDLCTWADNGDAAFGRLWSAIFGTPERARAAINSVKDTLGALWAHAQNIVKAFFGIEKAANGFNRVCVLIMQAVAGWKLLSLALKAAEIAQMAFNAISAMNPYVAAIMAAIAVGVLLYESWDKISAYVSAAWQRLTAVVDNVTVYIASVWQSLVSVFQSVGDAVLAVWEGIFQWFAAKFEWLTSTLSAAKNLVGGIFDRGELIRTPIIPRSGNTSNSTTTVDSNITVQNVNVQTQATDAKGIANGIGGALKDNLNKKLVAGVQTGVKQK